ncbi:hypothetical protein KR215_002624 [Drosophila sulfurigaster]|nr:hypothetical protein KR215_002624 [Drosophila sulfurigaster]
MPQRRENRLELQKVSMVWLRCFLTVSYLWLMLLGAAVIPELNKVTKGHLWFKSSEIYVTYSSILPFDAFTVPVVNVLIILMLYRLYKYCRCNFLEWIYYNQTVRSGDKIPLDTRMLFYFGPFLLLFSLYWISSICYIFKMIELCLEPIPNAYIMYSQIILALLFKIMVICNVVIRCSSGFGILQLFNQEARDYLINSHNFGDHLNLFFQY